MSVVVSKLCGESEGKIFLHKIQSFRAYYLDVGVMICSKLTL